MDQPHLGLPSREYYLNPRSAGDMFAYHTYMKEVTFFIPFIVVKCIMYF